MIIPNLICLINARSGSKRIKNKNIINFNNKPLIYWTIKAAINSNIFSNIYVNTDSKKIAHISEKYGAKVPFIRPSFLAEDKTSSVDSTLYFLNNLSVSADYFSLLQPTSPLRTCEDVINFHKFTRFHKFKSVVTISKLKNLSSKTYLLSKNYNLRVSKKSDYKKLCDFYYFNGSIYYNNINSFLRYKKFIFSYTKGYIMSDTSSIDIDTKEDLKIAKNFMKKYE